MYIIKIQSYVCFSHIRHISQVSVLLKDESSTIHYLCKPRLPFLGFVSPCIIIHSNKTNQPDASISQIYCSLFKYSSTFFGHPHAHHQELINCSSRLQFTVGTWW
jgi:hypothetical protein